MNDSNLPIKNIAAYQFVTLDELPHHRRQLYALCKEQGLRGTILLSAEGINLFLAGPHVGIDACLAALRAIPGLVDLEVKISYSERIPFRRLLVKIKREIITFNVPGINPAQRTAPKLPARTLKQWLDEGRPVTLLDVRNDYEVRLGAFADAVPIGVDNFRHFPEKVHALPEHLKQQPIVMYCTGGIRCEKAGPYMQQAGFREVYQLEGGILKYFEECGGAHYQGDCFVFDQRVALDSRLSETETTMCFACQEPLTADDQASPQYVVGESCPYCYKSPEETLQRTIAGRHAKLAEVTSPLPGSIPYENRRPIRIPRRCDGWSLWRTLQELFPFVGAEEWLEAIELGRVQRQRQPLAANATVVAGERLENLVPDTTEPDVNAQIEILFEDPMLVVVNKPAPLPMHPCGRFNHNTLISIMNHVYRPQQLRVAHRLDANTTGVVVLSRTSRVAGLVQPQFERGEVDKVYLVRANGHPSEDEFRCDAPIAETVGEGGCRVVAEDGLASRTDFRVIHRDPDGTSLLEVRPRTGRTNQIRLHLAHLNFPIVGDPMYGVPAGTPPKQTLDLTDHPLCLHAWQVTFQHPNHGQPCHFTAPPPPWAAGTIWKCPDVTPIRAE
jgi:RluA family pseudouridine synthase